MGLFRRAAALTVIGGSAAYLVGKTYIYVGTYHEAPAFRAGDLSLPSRLKYNFFGSNDDVLSTKSAKICNPNKNPVTHDYFEKEIDVETTKKILAKYKTNDELLAAMQKALLLGPTLWPHRFIVSPYLKSKDPNNRIAGFSYFEPALKNVDVASQPKTALFDIPLLPSNPSLKYLWNADDIKSSKGPLAPHTIIYGMFDFIENGKRSDGGFFSLAFGSDLGAGSAIHRFDYFVKKNDKGEKQLVFRMVNATFALPKGSPAPPDDTKGLHEFMTRTIVLDIIRGLEY